MKNWTVWVGGVEVNDYYLTKERADSLAQEYKDDGYDDVSVEQHDLDKLSKNRLVKGI